ncbi:hypothetical protein BTO06_08360 [Tenacibaculum sp. SZ-18]|uniref:hypothetical protein n=1 Tax=Tenacibaculum sp. SZ-18 TaxID=754423 RepID=UPI000C2D29D0|nr:hypothetical protein [Tenacibaculum sp. SZ-18]AUC15149.1 hypothetical protein BTO06_08360 [Tenacibaculum sp. SZ-18]
MKAKSFLLTILATIFSLLITTDSFAQRTVSYTSTKKRIGNFSIDIKGKGDFKIEYEGDIVLSEDDKDIVSISRGGFIEIKKSSFGKKRRLLIEAESGTLKKRYYVGWNEKSYHPEGKAWLAEILPEIIRNTTIGAESRVKRFYKKGGVNAVLSEIRELESDYVTSAYFSYLMEYNLNNSELIRVVDVAGDKIDSDYYLSEVLQKNQKAFLGNSQTLSAYIKASKNIQSDYYQSQVLSKAISNDDISDDQLGDLLQISNNIDSDYYLSQVLGKILDKRDLNKSNMEKVMTLSNSISSDYYKSQVLKKALKKKNLSNQNYKQFISSIDDVDSDYYSSSIIEDLLKKDLNNSSLTQLLGLINKNVGSDYYASSLYKKLAKKNLSEDQLIKVLNSLKNINSSNYLSSSLVAFAPSVKNSSQRVKDAYMTRAKSINSDTYFGRAMKAIY